MLYKYLIHSSYINKEADIYHSTTGYMIYDIHWSSSLKLSLSHSDSACIICSL
jgi:hypothetical protein